MTYEINFLAEAQEDLKKLPWLEAKRIVKKIGSSLSVNPFPRGKNPKCLRGKPRRYRLRTGNYRVIYRVESREVVVEVVGNRRDVYRRLK